MPTKPTTTPLNQPSSLGEAFDATLFDNLTGLSSIFIDASLNSLNPNSPASGLPLFSIIAGAAKTITSVSDAILANKVICFLQPLNNTSAEKRKKMITGIEDNQRYRARVGETLLNIINKTQDSKAAACLGYLFNSFLTEKITYDDFILCSNIINSIPYGCLYTFIKDDIDSIPNAIKYLIAYSGLFELHNSKPNIKVKDNQQLEKEKEMDVTFTLPNPLWFNPIIDPSSSSISSFNMLPNDEKYKVFASGGDIVLRVSHFGSIIKDCLKDVI